MELVSDWRLRIEDYVTADKLNWSLEHPDHAWIGPHVAEIALIEYDKLKERVEKLEARIDGLETDLRRIIKEGIDTSTDGGMDFVRELLVGRGSSD
jgi:hypothetical protein